MINSDTEKVMLAKVIVAAAVVDRTLRALSTVDLPTQSPASTPTRRRAATNATTTATAGRKKKLARSESDAARSRLIVTDGAESRVTMPRCSVDRGAPRCW